MEKNKDKGQRGTRPDLPECEDGEHPRPSLRQEPLGKPWRYRHGDPFGTTKASISGGEGKTKAESRTTWPLRDKKRAFLGALPKPAMATAYFFSLYKANRRSYNKSSRFWEKETI